MPTDGRGILRGPSGGELTNGGARDKTWVLWSVECSLNLQALLLSFCSLVYPFCMLISVFCFLKMVPQANALCYLLWFLTWAKFSAYHVLFHPLLSSALFS